MLRTSPAPAVFQERNEDLRLQSHGAEFCKPPERACKWVLLKSFQVRTQAGQHLHCDFVGPRAEKLADPSDF